MRASEGDSDGKQRRGISRRGLLIGGGAGIGLIVAWAVWPRSYTHNLTAAEGETIFNAFVKIGEDGHVAVIVPQAEMGQGVWTSLPQILADELGADWRTIAVEPAPINPLYANSYLLEEGAGASLPPWAADFGKRIAREVATRSALMITGGSTSIRGFEARYREAGAMARALLCSAAAQRWKIDWQACDTEKGFVTHGEDRLRFAELAAEAATLAPPEDVPLRKPGAGGASGKSLPRIDLPAKVDGSARFAADVRLPDMVHAAVRHGPLGKTTLAELDRSAAEATPGVLALFENAGWVGAAATNWWAANEALDAVRPVFRTVGRLADSKAMDEALRAAVESGQSKRFYAQGDIEAGFAGGKRISAAFAVPPAVHAPIEPLTATARFTGDRLEVWMPTQAPGMARAAAARAAGIGEGQVTVYPMLVGGGFGRKIELDAAMQAVVMAQRLKRPVQLTWSRAEETMRATPRPPAAARMAARLGPGGRILAWHASIAAPATGAELMGRLAPGLPIGGDQGSAEAGAVDGAAPPYAIPAIAVDHHPVAIGVPTGMWRSVAHSYTAFFTECFMDELAEAAGMDPLSFRMQHLGQQPRLAQCLSTATALGGWEGGEPGSGQGIACHSSFGSHCAMLAEAHVKEGSIKIDRIVAAVDCGRAINPDIIRQQIEGGIVWGMAGALGAALHYEAGLVQERNFDTLGLPILADMPEIVVEIVGGRDAPGGVGEVGVPPVAPAIANALFAATAKRLRTLPLTIGGA